METLIFLALFAAACMSFVTPVVSDLLHSGTSPVLLFLASLFLIVLALG